MTTVGFTGLMRGRQVRGRDMALAAGLGAVLGIVVDDAGLVEPPLDYLPLDVEAKLDAWAAAEPAEYGDWRMYTDALVEGLTGRSRLSRLPRLPGVAGRLIS